MLGSIRRRLADVFDALTSQRPYKQAWSTTDAITYMRAESGTSFDPRLLRLFLELVPKIEEIRQQHTDTPMLPI